MADFIDFQTLERPSSPNTFLLAPDQYCSKAKIDTLSPTLDASAGDVFERVKRLIEDTASWKLAHVDAASLRLSFVGTSRFLRFKDDVDIAVISSSESTSTLAIYSRSRVGYSDLGTNRKRVTQIIDHLTSI